MEILRPLSDEEINDDPLTPLCNDSECIYCLRHRGANHSIPSTSTNLFRSYEEIADILNIQGTIRVDFLRFMKMEATQIPIAKETRKIYERIRNLPSNQWPHKHVASPPLPPPSGSHQYHPSHQGGQPGFQPSGSAYFATSSAITSRSTISIPLAANLARANDDLGDLSLTQKTTLAPKPAKEKAKKKATKNPNWKEEETTLQCKLKRVFGTQQRPYTVWNKLDGHAKNNMQIENFPTHVTFGKWWEGLNNRTSPLTPIAIEVVESFCKVATSTIKDDGLQEKTAV